jgi:LPS sulfotransferase NodH
LKKKLFLADYFRKQGTPFSDQDFSKAVQSAAVTSVFITMMPGRCGSTLLANLSANYGFGTGSELFNELPENRYRNEPTSHASAAYLGKRVADNAVGGRLYFQITPLRLERFMAFASAESMRDMNVVFSLLFRRDIFAQALSYYNAVRSGIWQSHVGNQDKKLPPALDVDPEKIKQWVRKLLDSEQKAFAMCERIGIPPAAILYYEDLVAGPEASMIHFLKANRQQVAPIRFGAALTSGRAVAKLRRPESARQYLRLSRTMKGHDTLYQARLTNPHHDSTYGLFDRFGY